MARSNALAVALAATLLVTACSSGSFSEADHEKCGAHASCADPMTSTASRSAVPEPGVTSYELGRLPAHLAEIRRQELATPTGGTAHIRWFAVSGDGPTLTTNFTTGQDIGLHALADKRALAADLTVQSQRAGISLPAPAEFAVNGQPAIAYSDLLGWRSLSWAIDRDAVMAVTGLHFFDARLQQIARGVRFT
jgi:hypothetical protein